MSKSALVAAFCFAGCAAAALAQHSPAPDGPAEGPQRANPGSGTAPGVHPPSPMSRGRFAPGPPPPPPGSTETVPAGRVTVVESIQTGTPVPTPVATAVARPATTPAATATPAIKKKKAKGRKPSARPAAAPAPTKAPATR